MYYVGAYGDGSKGQLMYRFVGWSRNKLAVAMYNVAGHNSGAFYDHYEIFEYDCSVDEFIEIARNEWEEDITDWDNGESYIDIYETRHGDYLSVTNYEYHQLVLWTDIEYDMGISYMQTLYNLIGSDTLSLMRSKKTAIFIGYLASTYMNIFKDVEIKETTDLSSKIDKLQAFVCRVRNDPMMNIL